MVPPPLITEGEPPPAPLGPLVLPSAGSPTETVDPPLEPGVGLKDAFPFGSDVFPFSTG